MKTRCPDCLTIFRVTPEQLKARAGKVRCGQCQNVFNALDCLLDENDVVAVPAPAPPVRAAVIAEPIIASIEHNEREKSSESEEAEKPNAVPVPEFIPAERALPVKHVHFLQEEPIVPAEAPADPALLVDEESEKLTESAAQALGKATGLILPRETTEIPGYSKWSESAVTAASLSAEKAPRWPFIVVALLLTLALAGQLIFHFRSEIAITAPSMRPILEAFCQTFDAELPLPRHVDLVSIETSDLQNDPAHGNLLVLNATLRNRAGYAQAYPSLELSLTDTQDAAIARRVFLPSEYLSPKLLADPHFVANTDVPVRLWIEAKEITASGYRLYVFYP